MGKNKNHFLGKTAVIVGGSKGIGKATASELTTKFFINRVNQII